jgi:hypothetical protein
MVNDRTASQWNLSCHQIKDPERLMLQIMYPAILTCVGLGEVITWIEDRDTLERLSDGHALQYFAFSSCNWDNCAMVVPHGSDDSWTMLCQKGAVCGAQELIVLFVIQVPIGSGLSKDKVDHHANLELTRRGCFRMLKHRLCYVLNGHDLLFWIEMVYLASPIRVK